VTRMDEVLQNLLQLTGFSDDDSQILQKARSEIQKWEAGIVKVFYDTLYNYQPTSRLLGDKQRDDMVTSLSRWLKHLVSAEHNENFWKYQCFIGLVHIRRNIPNHLIIAMMSRIQTYFLAQSTYTFSTVEGMRLYVAFKKLTDIVIGLIAEGYFDGYLNAIQKITNLNRELVDRMVIREVEKLLEPKTRQQSQGD